MTHDRDPYVLSVLQQIDKIILLWRSESLHLYILDSEDHHIRRISNSFWRRTAVGANWLGIRTDTTVYRDAMHRLLLLLSPKINRRHPNHEQWHFENIAKRPQEELTRYHHLIDLLLSMLSAPPGKHELPEVPLLPKSQIILCEMLLTLQRLVEQAQEQGQEGGSFDPNSPVP